MAKKSKLLAALDAHKGRDYQAEKRKAQVKAAEKRKRQKISQANEADEEPEEVGEDVAAHIDEDKENAAAQPQKDTFAHFSDDDNEDGDDEDADAGFTNGTIPQPSVPMDASASEAEADSDVPLSDLEGSDLEDTIPYQKMTINNGPALVASTTRIAVVKSPSTPFHHHNSLISSLPPTSTSIPDPNDDLTRELEFYRIARTSVLEARKLLKAAGIPFSRPADYFAEMVKTDEHMTKVKQKMYDSAAGKKAAEEARKLRDAKKFGKQVQIAKEQERAREKRNTLDRVKELKRSMSLCPFAAPFTFVKSARLTKYVCTERKGAISEKTHEGNLDDDLFQTVNVEAPAAKDRSGRERGPGFNAKRQKRDQKYGFGGKKRHSKSGDAASSGDMRGFSAARMKGKPVKAKRPGKSRRAATR
jgi:rRNA-processing protein EBP2